MKAALLGKPMTGRKTLMAAMAQGEPSAAQPGRKSVVTIRVPDLRVDRLAAEFRPRKTTWATLEMALDDAPYDSLDKRLNAVRNVDVLVLVVAAHPLGAEGLDVAMEEADTLLQEMILADQMIVEKRVAVFRKTADKGVEAKLMERLLSTLEEGEILRRLELDELEEKLCTPFSFLTAKPILLVLNIAEEDLEEPAWNQAEDRLRAKGIHPVVLCARLEAEVAALAPEEQLEFLKVIGLERPASHRLVQAVYGAMDLISFFTVGEDEVRAWPVRAGSPAPIAGGKIHTDIRRGFIRAEVVSYDHFWEAGSLAAARRTGRLRTEGKDYVVQDGDIISFLFNV
jgi:ribosome-binding ATPase YchF (GTP1/OBG family)